MNRCTCSDPVETVEIVLSDDVLDYVIEETVGAVLEILALRASLASFALGPAS